MLVEYKSDELNGARRSQCIGLLGFVPIWETPAYFSLVITDDLPPTLLS